MRISAKDVPDFDAASGAASSDPFVEFKLLTAPYSTAATMYRQNTTNPVFTDEVLMLPLPLGCVPNLQVILYDKDWKKEDDVLATLTYVLEGSSGDASVILKGQVPEGEENAGEEYHSPVAFSWAITNGLPPPSEEATLVLYSLKDKVKNLPKAKGKAKGGEPLVKVELLEGGQVVREVSTAPLKEAKEASPQWPDQLQLLLGAGTVRPPQLRISLLRGEELLATCETHISTAPQGKEKLCLKALNTPNPKVEHWLDYKWRYLKEGAEPCRPATATTGRPSTAAASRPASARP